MLKCNIKKGRPILVKATGTAEDLTVETGMVVQQIYRNILKQNPAAAEGYKLNLLCLLLDPQTPVWKGE
jgi:hypothetical protein